MLNQFSAAGSTLGYLYQCRVALLFALRKIQPGDDFNITLETLDDIVFDKEGQPPELLQTKHHQTRSADLTDASPDLWKSLRIWCEGWATKKVPTNAAFYLITTSQAGDGSAAQRLRVVGRDVKTACERLCATAGTSANQENKRAYKAFLCLDEDQRRALLEVVFVIDSSPTISELDDQLMAEVRWAVENRHRDAFVSRLEGWGSAE